MVQKKLKGSEDKDEYHCVYCDDDFFVTLAEWRRHCKTHKDERDKAHLAHQTYKIWKARGFR